MEPTSRKQEPTLNPQLLKQAKQPAHIERILAKKNYLKYSAFSQLSNNGEMRSDEGGSGDNRKSWATKQATLANNINNITSNYIDF
jgi:hypothetical protein